MRRGAIDDDPRRGKRRKRRKGVISRAFNSLLFSALFLIIGAIGLGFFADQRMKAPGPLTEAQVHEVKSGQSARQIAEQLEAAGIIRNAELFLVGNYVDRSLTASTLKAGDYEIPAGSSIRDIMALMRAGKTVVYKVTIPEGWTTQRALARIAAQDKLTGEISAPPGEGALLPDTYVFKRGLARDELISRMTAARDKLLEDLWEQRSADLPIKTIDEAVILASIVEKETAVAEERPRVASVFLNRLRRGIRLQSDPTIIYGIVGGEGKLDRPIRRSDINRKTPYNTYRIDGLPPTPIANPGRESIKAVLNPITTDDLYFVADGTGGHVFAKTLAEHNRNVANWRQIERERRERQAQQEAEQNAAASGDATPAEPPAPAQAGDGNGNNGVAIAPAAVPESGTAQADAPALEQQAEASQKPLPRTVEISGRVVPIPRAKPQVQ